MRIGIPTAPHSLRKPRDALKIRSQTSEAQRKVDAGQQGIVSHDVGAVDIDKGNVQLRRNSDLKVEKYVAKNPLSDEFTLASLSFNFFASF